ncbi:MAG: CDP-alcohol phosphatidyltransferase family protein [Thermodesulfobacteriota bacterium]
MTESDGASNWNLPNAISLVRILLTPVFLAAFWSGRMDWALGAFVLAGVSDALDGTLARLLKQRTALGAILDPLADKFLLVAAYLSLGLAGWLPAWVVALVLARDLVILGGLWVLRRSGVDVRANICPAWASKCNTVAQIGLVFCVMLSRGFGLDILPWELFFLHSVAVLAAVSGGQYVLRGWALLSERHGRRPPDMGQ